METTLNFNYIIVEIPPIKYFKNIVEFVRIKFDTEEYENTVFLISTASVNPSTKYKEKYKNKHVIMYNWEQLCSSNQWTSISTYCNNLRGADELWDYDYLNRDYLLYFHNMKVDKIQPIEYVDSFTRINNVDDPDIDVLFYGLINKRRKTILSDIIYKSYDKFSVVSVSGCNSLQTEKFIANSKIILNIHAFYPYHRQEQERLAFLLANKKCIISEVSQHNYFGDAFIEVPSDKIYDNILPILKNNSWCEMGERGYNLFKMSPEKIIIPKSSSPEPKRTLKILVTAPAVNGLFTEGESILFIKMIIDNLRRLGYEVHTTDSPQNKLDESFDLIICSNNIILDTIKNHPAPKICISHGILSTELLQNGVDKYYSVSEENKLINFKNGIISDVIGQPVDKKPLTEINDMLSNILIIKTNSTEDDAFSCLYDKYNIKISDPMIPIEEQILWADLCITIGRNAVTSMSMGRAVIVTDNRKYGDGYLDESTIFESAKCNFSGRSFKIPVTDEWLLNELKKYDSTNSKFLYDYTRKYHDSRSAVRKMLTDVSHLVNHSPHKNIYGLLRIRNEEKIIKDTLDHMSEFCAGVFIYDDCSTDTTVNICESHPIVIKVVKGTECDFNEEYKTRQSILDTARETVELDSWFIDMNAEERIYMDWTVFHKNQSNYDMITMRVWDFYITEEDKHKNYNDREWIGPEYKDIKFMFRNHPNLKYHIPDQRKCSTPTYYRNTSMGEVKHYGKAIDIEEWEKTCDYYINHFEKYKTEWMSRKENSVHIKSDFGRDLVLWKDRSGYGVKLNT